MFNKVISIELGLYKSRICEMDFGRKSPHIYKCISFDTPENSYNDGYIEDKDALLAIIKEKLKEAGIRSKKLVFSITSSKVANREVLIPEIKKDRIQDVVMANADEYFPMDITDHAITYSILEKLTIDKDKKLRLLILAAPNSLVKEYYELAKMLGYEIESIDYLGNSVYQLAQNYIDKEISMLVHINDQMTFLNILEDGVLRLPRVINYGLKNILDILINSQDFSISHEEAYAILSTNNLFEKYYYNHVEVVATKESPLYIGDELNDSLEYLIGNIARILDYSSRNENKKISTIYLMGKSTKWTGLRDYIEQMLGIEVICFDTLYQMGLKKNIHIDKGDLPYYTPCIAASIRPVRFIPRDYLEKHIRSSKIYGMIFILASGVILSIIITLVGYFSYKNEMVINKMLKNEIANLSAINQVYDEYNVVAEKLIQLEYIYDLTLTKNQGFTELLEDIEDKMPSMVIVDSLNVTAEGLIISAVADSEVTVAKTLQQLKSIPELTDVFTASINISEDENKLKTVKFVIEAAFTDKALLEP